MSIIIFLLGKKIERYSLVSELEKNNEYTENDRNIAMNGINMKYYINFSFHYKLFNLFELVTKKLDEKNVQYFLICGGLIGYFRHNQGFIPWDDDVDIGVMEEDKRVFNDAMNELIEEEHISFTINHNNLGIDKIYKMNTNTIQIDVFYFKYFPKNDYYFYNDYKTRLLWPKEYIFKDELYPLKTINYILYDIFGEKFKEITIKIPNASEDYLDRAYNNWRMIKKPSHPHSSYYKRLVS